MKKIDKRQLLAIGLPSTLAWIFAYLGANVFQQYAWGLFVLLPFMIGASSSLIYGHKTHKTKKELFSVSMLTLFVFSIGLMLFALEGLICLLMVMPIAVALTWAGYWVAGKILQSRRGHPSATVILLFLSVPSLMAFESRYTGKEEVRSVITSIEINATPEEVWKNVIAFPRLKDPSEFIFKTGIAYPVDATIDGSGVGAIRHCNFSTGSFVEPITVWDEPHLLKFSVKEQPEPMKEISFYDLHPNHLKGFWVSKEGQFRLTALPNGRTLLEGTTWYVNRIKPGFYWTLWSDYIVHEIHERVLEHIKFQCEEL